MTNEEKHIPADIFLNRNLDSIGSLGVFYVDTSSQINMDYSIMSLMSTSGSFNTSDYDKNHSRTFTFKGVIKNIWKIKTFEEVEACINLPNLKTTY